MQLDPSGHPPRGVRWFVQRDADTPKAGEIARTRTGRVRTFARRAHAYAHAEDLNARDHARSIEERKALGL